jgi:hypothetical protein
MHWLPKTALLLLIVATPVKWAHNVLCDKTSFDAASRSSLEARLRRSFVCRARFVSPVFEYQGKKIAVDEAWVERRSKLRWTLVWFPYFENKGSYQLCFTLKEGTELFDGPGTNGVLPARFWVTGDVGHSFGKQGRRFDDCDAFQTLPSSVKLSILESWHQPRAKDIEIQICP